MKKLLAVGVLLLVSACSSVKVAEKHEIKDEDIKNWDRTIAKVVVEESLIPDWYGNQNPIYYLQKTGKMSEKDFNFLTSLGDKNVNDITDDEFERFVDLVKKYNKKMPRKFFLENENIKDPKGLVEAMVRESYLRMDTPSSHIKEVVATPEEWEEIVAFSKQTDLNEKDVKKLRKLLNSFIKRDEFYSTETWYNREVSARTIKIAGINARENKTAIEKNNVNAKALYLAYPEYFSKLEKWDD